MFDFKKASVQSLPANLFIIAGPPGCRAANSVKSYTFPSIYIHKSSGVLCLFNSSIDIIRASSEPGSFFSLFQTFYSTNRIHKIFMID